MPQELDDSQWWLDDKVWLDLFGPLFIEDSSQADQAARLWHRLLAELEDGPEGLERAMTCLENALRLTFTFTKTYRSCRILFEMSLGEDFPANMESLALISEALKRTKAALRRGPVAESQQRRKRSRR